MRLMLLLVFTCSTMDAFEYCGNQQWLCGDKCIWRAAPCHCGDQTIIFQKTRAGFENQNVFETSELAWCCTNASCARLGSGDGGWTKGANCSVGNVLKLTEPCPNNFISTQNTRKQTRKDLGGKATDSCNDFDSPDIYTDKFKEIGLRSYIPCWELQQKIPKCIKKSFQGDGKFDCESRSDEDPFTEGKKKTLFDPNILLTECRDHENTPGLMCGDECLRIDDWCQIKTTNSKGRVEGPRKCDFPGQKQFFSNDKSLCSNQSFWKDKECPEYRCNGAFPGQCGATVAVQSKDVLCKDESDSNKRDNGDCPETAIACKGNLIRPLSTDCQAYENYPDYYPDLDFDSECQETDIICIEKNSTSRCDLHPQCEHGEDEIKCEEEYLKRGIFNPTQTFVCDFPSHTISNSSNSSSNWTIYTHRAIRCDGDATCPRGEDEKNCQILAETVKYIIRK